MATAAPRRESAFQDTEPAPPPPVPVQPQIPMGFTVPLAGAGQGAGVYHGPVTVNGGQPAWMWVPAPAPPAAPLCPYAAYNGPGTLVVNGVVVRPSSKEDKDNDKTSKEDEDDEEELQK
ncbi:hypothetical protein LTR86_002976 [Recurvomyces mirabilis]|nr:hypothetical protein LTR86_002976 [Recurvomyces mirabilis]